MSSVLVVGAGPTGLLMAAEAARYGMSCRIIDKLPLPLEKSRALAIQPRTMELFDHLGIADLFLKEGLKILGANPCSGKKRLAHLSFKSLDSDFPFILSIEQSKTEKILTHYLSSFGIKVERNVEFIDLRQESNRVLAILRDHSTGKEEQTEAAWVIGCDGAHSQVRKSIGIPFEGKPFHSIFSLADVALDWKERHDELFLFLDPDGILGTIPMPGERRYRLVFQLERCQTPTQSEIDNPTLEEVKRKVRQSIGENVKVSDPIWLANFHINSRLVKSYRKGRVFLAGDAAHIHSPAGGQGMNSGLQDVFNLGWKLASGNETLLDTYSLERRSWGLNLIRATRWTTLMATLRNPIGVFLRNRFIQHIIPKIERRLIRAIAQISIQYPKSIIADEEGIFDGGPKAGTRAPNAPIGSKDLYSILRNTTLYHLLLFGGWPEPFPESFKGPGISRISIHTIKDEKAQKIYGVKKAAAYVIRPDQYIGHRSSNLICLEKYFSRLFNDRA